MRGPGDRAPKHRVRRWEPTPSSQADGHGASPNNVDLDEALPPGSWSSASAHMPHAREPGDLGGASLLQPRSTQPREGESRNARSQASEESDVGVVPKKSAKAWATPVESMEGRAAADG